VQPKNDNSINLRQNTQQDYLIDWYNYREKKEKEKTLES
jgi:hypothetical protein